jgi:hypothetical protein
MVFHVHISILYYLRCVVNRLARGDDDDVRPVKDTVLVMAKAQCLAFASPCHQYISRPSRVDTVLEVLPLLEDLMYIATSLSISSAFPYYEPCLALATVVVTLMRNDTNRRHHGTMHSESF